MANYITEELWETSPLYLINEAYNNTPEVDMELFLLEQYEEARQYESDSWGR